MTATCTEFRVPSTPLPHRAERDQGGSVKQGEGSLRCSLSHPLAETIDAPIVEGAVFPTLALLTYEQMCECRNCGSPVNREHFGVLDFRRGGQCTTLVYCEFCEIGWETLWSICASFGNWSWRTYTRHPHRGAELDAFRARLEAADA